MMSMCNAHFLRGCMPAMPVSVLSDTSARAHTVIVAVGDRLSILPDRNRVAGSVPLWKVMVGPAPTNSNRTRKGPVFFVFDSAQ
jgi:hypothetical protein